MPAEEPIYDLAHLAHAELLTPKPDESLHFFVDIMGMTESGRQGDSVYLRGWDDYEHHTLKLTAAAEPGLGHYAFRATSPQALRRRVAALERSGLGDGWSDGDLGHGPAYCFPDPDGHRLEVYYETEWYSGAARSCAPRSRTRRSVSGAGRQRAPDRPHQPAGRGCAREPEVHAGIPGLPPDRADHLRRRLREGVLADGLQQVVRRRDLLEDHYGAHGRLHHLTYAVDSREEVLRAADICLDNGVFIETGPHKHAIQQTFFLYMYEPGGNRFEVANAGARLVLAPDWKPVIWSEAERKKGQAWGLQTIASFHEHGTPVVQQ